MKPHLFNLCGPLWNHLRSGEVCIDPSMSRTLVGTADVRVLRDQLVQLESAGLIERWQTGEGRPVDLGTVSITWLTGRVVGARQRRAAA